MARSVAVLIVAAVIALASGATLAQGQPGAKSPVIGAWKIVETQNGPVTQPSLYIFTARHYSRMNVAANQPRAQFKDPANATPQEKVAAYDTFTANTGTYQISGDSIVFDVMLAKVPNNLGRGNAKTTFKIESQTLTITNLDNKNFVKLTRVE